MLTASTGTLFKTQRFHHRQIDLRSVKETNKIIALVVFHTLHVITFYKAHHFLTANKNALKCQQNTMEAFKTRIKGLCPY